MTKGGLDHPEPLAGRPGFVDPDVVPADMHRRAARVVLVHEGRVLAEHVGGPVTPGRRTWWELPGGGVEPGETTAEAARRELAEETGYLDVEVGPVVATARVRAIGAVQVAEQHTTFHVASLRSDRRDDPRLEPVEADDLLEVAWLTLDELATLSSLVPPQVVELVRDVMAGCLVPRRLGDHDLRILVDGGAANTRDLGVLPDGGQPRMVDDQVVRDAAPWTSTVHAWLGRCRELGIDGVPEPLGVDAFGREAVMFVPGAVTGSDGVFAPALRETDGLAEVGALLAQLREAAAGLAPSAEAVWRTGPGTLEDGQVVAHGDIGHGNLVWRDDGRPALIDWEFIQPGAPLRDLAEAACWLVPLVEFDHEARGFDRAPDRRARLAALARGSGVTVDALLGAVDHYLDVEVARVRDLGERAIPPWDSYLAADQPAGFARVRDYLATHRLP